MKIYELGVQEYERQVKEYNDRLDKTCSDMIKASRNNTITCGLGILGMVVPTDTNKLNK